MKRSQGAINLGSIRWEPKTAETKIPVRRAGCRESMCGLLPRRKLSLDIPFYSTFPMGPFGLFRWPDFRVANLLTLFLYSAWRIVLFLFPLYLIQVHHYSAT